LTKAAAASLVGVVLMLLWPLSAAAAPVPVRFAEGVTHGFMLLHTVEGALIATGDLLQVVGRGGAVESRMVFRFNDGSMFDEAVVFNQQRFFTLQSYRLSQHGPAFSDDTDISFERKLGKYRVRTTRHTDGRQDVIEGNLELPPDVYNGMVVTVAKNLTKGAGETVHIVAFTPAPRVIELEVAPAGEHKILVGKLTKTAVHYTFHPKLTGWLKLFATLSGRLPADYNVWIATDDVPAFVRFEGPLNPTGPAWRIQLTSPGWPD
jgi:hypothetical protein